MEKMRRTFSTDDKFFIMEKIGDADNARERGVMIFGIVLVSLAIMTWLLRPIVERGLHQVLPVSWLTAVSKDALKEIGPLYGLVPVGYNSLEASWARAITDELRVEFHRPEMTVMVFATKVPTANLFSLPDGKIIVTADLLAVVKDPNERRTVIYHEAGHFMRNHAIRAVLQSVGSTFLAMKKASSEEVSEKLGSVINLGYTVDEENEADEVLTEWMNGKAIPPRVYASALKKIAAAGPSASKLIPAYLDTHPRDI